MQKIDIKEIPTSPGIYIFKDEYEEPLYVGKAKNLRKRVPSYFREKSSWKIKRLVAESKDLSFVVSKNEADALLAEYSFIQEYKPKYNVQFKDDKSYPYVTLSNEEWPRAYISRRISQRNKNFGPFPFIGSARRSLDHLINIFPVRTCSKNVFERHQKLEKACLLYDIKKCAGPCIGASHLENARTTQTLMVADKKSVDVVGIDISNFDVVISCLLIRNGRIIGEVKKTLEPIDTEQYEEYLPQIILSIFSENQPSDEILVSHNFPFVETVQKSLSEKWDKSIVLKTPVKGWKKDLLETAILDAKEIRRVVNFRRRTDLEFRSQSLEQLRNNLDLKQIPFRIEAFDISNLGAEYRAGSMVVMDDGICKPSMYRKFHIKSFTGQDHFKSMEEVLFRRLKRLIKPDEKDKSFKRKPDLILIDGGKGQLSSAKSVIDHFKLDIEVIGLAKKFEEIFKPNRKDPFILDKSSESMILLQNIRDEAHRFAITENRRLRIKNFDDQTLLSINGVGVKSSDILLKRFKDVSRLSKATYEELREVVSDSIARKVYSYFNGDF